MPIDSSKFQRQSSRLRISVDAVILSDVNERKSNQNAQIDRSVAILLPNKNHHQSLKAKNCQISRL